MHSAPRALIAGLGLIGGSIGMALRAKGWRIAFLDPNVDLDEAKRVAAAHDRVDSLRSEADVVILATPVDVALKLLGTRHAAPGTLITSVASVMEPLREAATNLNFIAGHPLAGSHEHGLRAARADLMRDRAWFVDRRNALVERMIADCGARLEVVNAKEHDAAVALTSHLPQVLSTALAAYLERESGRRAAGGERDLLDFAGAGLHTFLRLAGSDASVWLSVIEANHANLLPHIDALRRLINEVIGGDAAAFEEAQAFMEKLKR